jgi:peroxiredoxin
MMRTKFVAMAAAMLLGAGTATAAVEIGEKAPHFRAVGTDGKDYSLDKISKTASLVVVCFTCNQCPVAVAYEDRFVAFNKKYADKDVKFIALNCNNKTEDLAAMKKRAEEKNFNFVYAFDETGNAARDYGASATPELFVIQEGKVVYHGSFDDKMKDPSKAYLADAVDALLAGKAPEVASTKPFGCSIKLK